MWVSPELSAVRENTRMLAIFVESEFPSRKKMLRTLPVTSWLDWAMGRLGEAAKKSGDAWAVKRSHASVYLDWVGEVYHV